MLQLSAGAGEIDLKYLDGQGFVCRANQATPITLKVNKNIYNKRSVVVVD